MFGLFGKKRSPEEIIESQGGASVHGKPGDTVRVTGGVSGAGLYNPQQSGVASQNYNIMDNGRLVVNPGVEEYKWNDRLKRYDAVAGMGRGYLLVDSVKSEEDEEEEKEGGGGSPEQVASSAASLMNVGTPGGTVIPGTYQGGSNGSVGILGVPPGSQNWSPQVGTLNPLADPNQFYVDLPPIQMDQEQRYINPSLSNPYLGVLV